MATKVTYTCDYCGKELKYKGTPLLVNVLSSGAPYMTKEWKEICKPCKEHIAEQIERLLCDIGDNCDG